MFQKVNIQDLKNLLADGEMAAMAFIEKRCMFPWVEPEHITGLDEGQIIKLNRAKHFFAHFSIPPCEEDLEGDDEVIAEYLEQCVIQRNTLRQQLCVSELVSPLMHVKALLYLAIHFETYLNYTQIDRESLDLRQLDMVLTLLETTIQQTVKKYLKESLIDFTYSLYCYSMVSPELPYYKNIEKFISIESNRHRLDNLYNL